MDLKNFIFINVFIIAFALLYFSCRRLYRYIAKAQPENRFGSIGKRIGNVLKIAMGQSKILREPFAGLLHALIFWGFLLFLFSVLEVIVQGFYSPFNWEFLGPIYGLITLTQDVFGLLVFVAVLVSIYRRYILKVERLQTDEHGQMDAALILVLIILVVVSMYSQNMAHIAKNNFLLADYELRPISLPISKLVYSGYGVVASTLYEVSWWIHILVVFGFMNYLPYSKHLHVITSLPNVFFATLRDNKHALKPLDLEDEEVEWFGSNDVETLSWKQLLDGYTCTECGRCTSVCPANIVGKSLSPRKIITDIRDRTLEKGPLLIGEYENQELSEKTLLGNYTTAQELWQCTTCGACQQECPVMIEHISSIVAQRRYLALDEGDIPQELNTLFKNLESNFAPWAFSQSERADWADGLGVKTYAEHPDCDLLFWVGCAGSYDDRYKKVSKAVVNLLQKANVDFRILGTEEKCNGDVARRLGNEYLAQELIQQNIETLGKYNIKKIITACPHCFNSLKQEFPQFGAEYQVIHHSEFLVELLKEGKLELDENNVAKQTITYHDSCYLGRYNDIYHEPREILERSTGKKPIEMQRNKSRGFCCGAGGGRLFLEDKEGGRINVERTEELLTTQADTVATACPFCMTMLQDGLKEKNKEENIQVTDIAEILLKHTK